MSFLCNSYSISFFYQCTIPELASSNNFILNIISGFFSFPRKVCVEKVLSFVKDQTANRCETFSAVDAKEQLQGGNSCEYMYSVFVVKMSYTVICHSQSVH